MTPFEIGYVFTMKCAGLKTAALGSLGRHMLAGANLGAVGGASAAEEGNRFSGALKGSILGAAGGAGVKALRGKMKSPMAPKPAAAPTPAAAPKPVAPEVTTVTPAPRQEALRKGDAARARGNAAKARIDARLAKRQQELDAQVAELDAIPKPAPRDPNARPSPAEWDEITRRATENLPYRNQQHRREVLGL
jgi:hypothetical protein